MIPFFRKIRKKMADDNRTLKYARYAIGEIVLVVVGILIGELSNQGFVLASQCVLRYNRSYSVSLNPMSPVLSRNILAHVEIRH